MNVKTASIAMPQRKRAVPPGRKSEYHDKLAALVAGSDMCVVNDNFDVPAAKRHTQLASAVSQYRNRTGDRGRFTVRTFPEVVDGQETGREMVAVWKLEGTIPERAKKADTTADAGNTNGADGGDAPEAQPVDAQA